VLEPADFDDFWATTLDEHLMWAGAGFVQVVMDTRGQGAQWGSGGATADTGHAGGPSTPGLMTRGIEAPKDYYSRRLYVDAHHAVEAAAALEQVDATRVTVLRNLHDSHLLVGRPALSDETAPAVVTRVLRRFPAGAEESVRDVARESVRSVLRQPVSGGVRC